MRERGSISSSSNNNERVARIKSIYSIDLRTRPSIA